jgi:hypothetical protein
MGRCIIHVIWREVERREQRSYRPESNAKFDERSERKTIWFSEWIMNWCHCDDSIAAVKKNVLSYSQR